MLNSGLNKTIVALAGIGLSAMLLLYFIVDPGKTAFFPKCPFLMLTGLYCPGCGSQRAIHALLNGDILIGIQYNILILLFFAVISYLIIRQGLKQLFNFNSKNLLHYPIVTQSVLVLVVLFWVFRNVTVYPFTLLAP